MGKLLNSFQECDNKRELGNAAAGNNAAQFTGNGAAAAYVRLPGKAAFVARRRTCAKRRDTALHQRSVDWL
jgi:hypothetical protein